MNPEEKLKIITEYYFNEKGHHDYWNNAIAKRRNTIPGIQAIIHDFVEQKTTIQTFRDKLSEHLRKPGHDNWGTKFMWMQSLNQLVKNHNEAAEETLRQTLDGLNAQNVTERFESFKNFLLAEKQRYPDQGKKLVEPGISLYFISLFAEWLDPFNGVIVKYPTMHKGLFILHSHGVLPDDIPLSVTKHGVLVRNAEDYHTLEQVFDWIATNEPRFPKKQDGWYEYLTSWVCNHKHDIPIWIKGEGDSSVEPIIIDDTPLAPISPARMAEQIDALRRQLLIPKAVIERIAHALMLGHHVILSGPPGTGKTELAKLLPRLLWITEEQGDVSETIDTVDGEPYQVVSTTRTAYDVRVVTATDEWTPRHVIGGIVPKTEEGKIRYDIAYGCLAETICDNWDIDTNDPDGWTNLQRKMVQVTQDDGSEQTYRGRWLVIDEFNRAPIDLALGEALTALGGGTTTLQIPTSQGTTAALPIPQDFRIIGTLNTFDRHFLNEMSEALKRRFTFIEVLPPTREERDAEQAMVLHYVLHRLQHLKPDVISVEDTIQQWEGLVMVEEGTAVPWEHVWDSDNAAKLGFEAGWRLFEVIRLYRQFGTAQAIAWAVNYFGAGVLRGLALGDDGWQAQLDNAFADTLADQLQVLFPDEIEVLLDYIKPNDAKSFPQSYQEMLTKIINPNRRKAHMLALQSVKKSDGTPYLSLKEAQKISKDEKEQVPEKILTPIFHADQQRSAMPLFAERLERFVFERTI